MIRANYSVDWNVEVEVHDLSGELLRRVRARNALVDGGRTELRDLLGGTGFRPDTIAVGSSSVATTSGMTALVNPILSKAISRRVPSGFGIRFQAVIDASEGNGTTFREIGTFRGSTMLARALLAVPIVKTNAVTVTLSHIFTVQ